MIKPARRYRLIGAIFVVGVLVGIAALLSSQRKPIPATTCAEALLQLDDAITVWAELNDKQSLDVPLLADLGDQFRGGKSPACPEGGTLQLGTRSLATVCTIHGHANDLRESHLGKVSQLSKKISELNPFRARHTGGPNVCIANLRQIDGAKQQWALENKKKPEDISNAADLAPFLKSGEIPQCRHNGGGKYILNAVGKDPECTKKNVNSSHQL